jgi:hypothetical protein
VDLRSIERIKGENMNRRFLVILLLVLTIQRWASALEAGKLAEAQAMMVDGSPYWRKSTEEALKKAAWKNHRVLELPAEEQPYAPPGTKRVQWELQVDEQAYYKLLCADVREKSGKIEALNATQYCNKSGNFESMLDPLLFEEGDVPGAKLHTYGAYQSEQAIARGMPRPVVSASANAKRSPDEPLPTYFVNLHLFEPASADQAFTWWQNQAPPTRETVAGIGDRAFRVEQQVATGTSRSITFTRCSAVVQVDAFIPMNGLAIEYSAVEQAAKRVDQRLHQALCGKPAP